MSSWAAAGLGLRCFFLAPGDLPVAPHALQADLPWHLEQPGFAFGVNVLVPLASNFPVQVR